MNNIFAPSTQANTFKSIFTDPIKHIAMNSSAAKFETLNWHMASHILLKERKINQIFDIFQIQTLQRKFERLHDRPYLLKEHKINQLTELFQIQTLHRNMEELISDLSQKILNYKHQVIETNYTHNMAMGSHPTRRHTHVQLSLIVVCLEPYI